MQRVFLERRYVGRFPPELMQLILSHGHAVLRHSVTIYDATRIKDKGECEQNFSRDGQRSRRSCCSLLGWLLRNYFSNSRSAIRFYSCDTNEIEICFATKINAIGCSSDIKPITNIDTSMVRS